jgi:hypothetical protein
MGTPEIARAFKRLLTGFGKNPLLLRNPIFRRWAKMKARKILNVSQWIHLRLCRALISTHHQNLEFLATKPLFCSLLRLLDDVLCLFSPNRPLGRELPVS